MEAKFIVPGFYAEIQDYNLLALKDSKPTLKEAVVLLADLPDFIYIPDENSSDVNAVRRVRISPNTLLPITNVTEVIRVLSGENIIDGILTQAQKDELVCKDIINILKMNKEAAEAGQLAIVKIVKRDGTRPNMNDKFEVYQALENSYEKLGNIKASQIVPVGISGEEDFVTENKPVSTLVVSPLPRKGAYDKLKETIFNNSYMFNPSESYKGIIVEFKLDQPVETFDACETTGTPTPQATKINDNGLDSEVVKELLKGTVVVAGTNVATNLQLEFNKELESLVLSEEATIEVIPGEVELILAKGHVFSTLKTKLHGVTNKTVVAAAVEGPAINWYIETAPVEVKKLKNMQPIETVHVGELQAISLDITLEDMPWVSIVNKGNVKEVVNNVRVIVGIDTAGMPNYAPTKSGTIVVTFKNNIIKNETSILVDGIEAKKATLKTNATNELVLAEEVRIETEAGIKIVIDENTLVVRPVETTPVSDIYFDSKSDEITEPVYVISYVPEGAEPIMKSLEYAQELTKNLSETLVVWGVRPPETNDPEELVKYANKLAELPKFKKGFKKRLSASKEIDLGMFLTVVIGSQKVNGIGGISNSSQIRILDYERTNGGTGEIKRYTDKLFVEITDEFSTGMNVEIKTYVGVKAVIEKAKVLSTKTVFGKTMVTLDKTIDTSIFDLNGFDVMLTNVDSKDRHGSYTAALFAVKANTEKDRAPVAQELSGTCDINFPGDAQKILLVNRFTVINVDPVSGNGIIVDCPLMTRNDSDFKERSQIGCVLYFLKKLREIANSKKGKRFPQKEQKVLFEDELRDVFKNELSLKDAIISNFEFVADMSRLDSKGFLAAKFKIVDTKKFKTAEFSGGLAKL